jgi:hypothetical protein
MTKTNRKQFTHQERKALAKLDARFYNDGIYNCEYFWTIEKMLPNHSDAQFKELLDFWVNEPLKQTNEKTTSPFIEIYTDNENSGMDIALLCNNYANFEG